MSWPVVYALAGLVVANVTALRHRPEIRELAHIHVGRTVIVLGTLLALVAIVWPLVVCMAVVHWLSPKA